RAHGARPRGTRGASESGTRSQGAWPGGQGPVARAGSVSSSTRRPGGTRDGHHGAMTSRSLGLVVTLGLMVPGCSHHRGDGAEHPGASRTAQTGHPALSKPCPGTEPRSQPSEPPTTGTAPVARTVPPVATTPQSDFVAIVSEA